MRVVQGEWYVAALAFGRNGLAHSCVPLEVVSVSNSTEIFPKLVDGLVVDGQTGFPYVPIEAVLDDGLDGGVIEHIVRQPHTGQWAVGDFYKGSWDWTALACHGVVGGVNERKTALVFFYHKSCRADG